MGDDRKLQSVVVPSKRHSAVAVDLRRVVLLAGRLVHEKVRKECPCVVSSSAATCNDIAR